MELIIWGIETIGHNVIRRICYPSQTVIAVEAPNQAQWLSAYMPLLLHPAQSSGQHAPICRFHSLQEPSSISYPVPDLAQTQFIGYLGDKHTFSSSQITILCFNLAQ